MPQRLRVVTDVCVSDDTDLNDYKLREISNECKDVVVTMVGEVDGVSVDMRPLTLAISHVHHSDEDTRCRFCTMVLGGDEQNGETFSS